MLGESGWRGRPEGLLNIPQCPGRPASESPPGRTGKSAEVERVCFSMRSSTYYQSINLLSICLSITHLYIYLPVIYLSGIYHLISLLFIIYPLSITCLSINLSSTYISIHQSCSFLPILCLLICVSMSVCSSMLCLCMDSNGLPLRKILPLPQGTLGNIWRHLWLSLLAEGGPGRLLWPLPGLGCSPSESPPAPTSRCEAERP